MLLPGHRQENASSPVVRLEKLTNAPGAFVSSLAFPRETRCLPFCLWKPSAVFLLQKASFPLNALVYDLAPLFHELTNAPGAIVRCQVQYR